MFERELFRLTHPQQRIWIEEQINPDSSMFNIGGTVRIYGAVNLRLLEQAVLIFIRTNHGMRLKIVDMEGAAKQYIGEFDVSRLDYKDFRSCPDPVSAFQTWVNTEAAKPFRLTEEWLFYFAMFRIDEQDSGYFIKLHHIIADGWSIRILTDQICSIYKQLLYGEEINEQEIENTYIDYVELEQQYLNSERFLKNKRFWNERFAAPSEVLPIGSKGELRGMRKSYTLTRSEAERIQAGIRQLGSTFNAFISAAFVLYWHKITCQHDIVIGTPVLNRSGKEKRIFGMFTSTMPVRVAIDVNCTGGEFVANVSKELKTCYFHQKYPYDLLIQDLETVRNSGHNRLFDLCVNYYNTKLHTDLNGLPIENTEFYNGEQNYLLQLIIREWSDTGSVTLDYDYRLDAFSDECIERMYNGMMRLIWQMIEHPERRLTEFCVLDDEEKHELLYSLNETNQPYPKQKSIVQLFEEQVLRTPNKIAIQHENASVTYAQLNERANQLANYLVQQQVIPHSLVGLMMDHSIQTVVALLAIMKAGAGYVPIDPEYPAERIKYMILDSNVGLVLTNRKANSLDLSPSLTNIVQLQEEHLCGRNTANLDIRPEPEHIAYVIYTSGSTGKPKGTIIEHRSLVNYIWWAKVMYTDGEDDSFPLYSSLSFDLTVTSIFTPLISGGMIVIYPKEENGHALYRILEENLVTVIKLTPSHLAMLDGLNNEQSKVRRLIVGGENLKTSLAKSVHESFGGKVRIFNEYGPTEATVGCMIYELDGHEPRDGSVPIGKPAANVQIYVLDEYLQPVPKGAKGELFISGDGVARGYLNCVDLTSRRFIRNPFLPDRIMYRTGDYVTIGKGCLEFHGRIDHQVKIRGHRIDLGEIEAVLAAHEQIRDVVVIDCEGRQGHTYLCGYVVVQGEPSTDDLRKYAMERLPDYMVPECLIRLERIPLTHNGKVNRMLLPNPYAEAITKREIIASRNDREALLIRAISDVLQVDRVSMDDNFFQLGGDSIKSIQVSARLNVQGMKLKVKDILQYPLLAEMACRIEDRAHSIRQDACQGEVGMLPAIAWFQEQQFAQPDYYHQSILLELDGTIEIDRLERIWNAVLRHHDGLRLQYCRETGRLHYNEALLQRDHAVDVTDLSALADAEKCERMVRICTELKSSLNLENDLLVRMVVFDLGNQNKRLFIMAHHLIMDGVSWRIILNHIYMLLQQSAEGLELRLPFKTHSLQAWSTALHHYIAAELDTETPDLASAERQYWEDVHARRFSFPLDFDLGTDTVAQSDTLIDRLSERETRQLLDEANEAYHTRTQELLLAALSLAVMKHAETDDIVIELEGHGREDIGEEWDVSDTVGWFTSFYPVRFRLPDANRSERVKALKEQLRNVPANGFHYGLYKYVRGLWREHAFDRVRFNYLGEFLMETDNAFFRYATEYTGPESASNNVLTCLLDINCLVVAGHLEIRLTYSKHKFRAASMQNFLDEFLGELREIINHCTSKEEIEFTPSDFSLAKLSQKNLDFLFQ